jgi:hypothetical protein
LVVLEFDYIISRSTSLVIRVNLSDNDLDVCESPEAALFRNIRIEDEPSAFRRQGRIPQSLYERDGILSYVDCGGVHLKWYPELPLKQLSADLTRYRQ